MKHQQFQIYLLLVALMLPQRIHATDILRRILNICSMKFQSSHRLSPQRYSDHIETVSIRGKTLHTMFVLHTTRGIADEALEILAIEDNSKALEVLNALLSKGVSLIDDLMGQTDDLVSLAKAKKSTG